MYQIQHKCGNCGHTKTYESSLDVHTEIKCDKCETVSSVIRPINGFIYVLSNSCMPGLVKIGFTTRNIEERIKELNSASGVPDHFKVEATFITNNPAKDEQSIHSELSEVRVNDAREFFRLDPLLATNRISEILGWEPYFSKQEIEFKRKEEEKERKQRQLESLGVFMFDPGTNIAKYSFVCRSCGQRYYSRTPRNHRTMCPRCFSKEI